MEKEAARRRLTALSWGAGVQSTTLLAMAIMGKLGPLDVAIFADTGYEHDYTYEVFEVYSSIASDVGIDVLRVGDADLFERQFQHVDLPLFIEGTDRMLTRKCTRDYKIRPIKRAIRSRLGVKPIGRLAGGLVELWLGISTDEIERAKPSRDSYIINRHPLLELDMSRGDCETWLKDNGLPVPTKSGCRFCPYQSNGDWMVAEKARPEDTRDIIRLTEHINGTGMVRIKGKATRVSFKPMTRAYGGDMCDGGYCMA